MNHTLTVDPIGPKRIFLHITFLLPLVFFPLFKRDRIGNLRIPIVTTGIPHLRIIEFALASNIAWFSCAFQLAVEPVILVAMGEL